MSTIAVIAQPEGRDFQPLLAGLVQRWSQAGTRVSGLLAQRLEDDQPCSAGFLHDIVSGKEYSVHLDAPPAGASCHLDAAGMEEACAALLGEIPSADIVVLSKFGKLEAAGGGLRPAFDIAAQAGKPLLTTVSPRHVAAWAAFAPDAVWLEPEPDAVGRWWRTLRDRAA